MLECWNAGMKTAIIVYFQKEMVISKKAAPVSRSGF